MKPLKTFLKPLPSALHSKGRSKDQRAGEGNKKKGANSERAELVGYFADEINKERKGTRYRPVTYRYIGVKLAHIKSLSDLYYLKSTLEDYRTRGNSFSKGFFGSLKARPTDV
jgi:hypothetical protein